MAQLVRNMLPEKAIEKAKWYCSFQERCKFQVMNRFVAWKVEKRYFNQLIETLEDEDFLNEKRFVEAYVRGKFLMKNWGKLKIKNQLYQLKISEQLINEALNSEIDDDKYLETLDNLYQKKLKTLATTDEFKKKEKLFRYLISKGFETDLVAKVIG